ncbi:MAG: DUF1176 domain-containing protein [Hyphomicrobiales bacterium]
MSAARAIALVAILLAGLACALPAAAETRTFRDWTASCDDGGACQATTSSRVDSADYLILMRTGTPDSRWNLGFSTNGALADRNRPVNVRVDGGPAATLAPVTGYEAFGAPQDFFIANPGAGRRIFDEMAGGAAMRVEYIDVSGSAHDLDFSLSGLSASLLWIDERQGRLGSPRLVSAPEHLAPAEPVDEAGHIAAAGLPARLMEMHARITECESSDSELIRSIDPVIAALSDTATLYALPCSVGAYQAFYRLYVVERGEIGGIRPLYFADYSESYGWTGTDMLASVEWDEASGTLTSFAKGRGLGDCGSIGSWVWKDYDFAMVEYQAHEQCDGTEPGDWEVVFSRR